MKREYFVWLLAIFAAFMLSACKGRVCNEDKNQSVQIPSAENTQIIENADGNMEDTLEEIPEDISGENTESFAKESADNNVKTGGIQVQKLIINVGGQQFKATLYDNETAHALVERLPMTLNMEELHGNEKYYYLEKGLPSNAESIDRIQTGDIMLFGSDCLVLFYDDFSTSYSYTRIGHIEDEGVLADALGKGTIEVSLEADMDFQTAPEITESIMRRAKHGVFGYIEIQDEWYQAYQIDFADLEEKLFNPQTTLLILCNPHNPIGKIWEKETLKKIGDLCSKYHVLVLSDEIHCDLTEPGWEYTPFASLCFFDYEEPQIFF